MKDYICDRDVVLEFLQAILNHPDNIDINKNELSKQIDYYSNLSEKGMIDYLSLNKCDIKSLPSNLNQLGKLRGFLKASQSEKDPYDWDEEASSINFSQNKISNVPESISNIETLEILNLDNNLLESLPETIGNLINLKSLSLSNNHLTKIPDTIGNLKNLKALNLANNQLKEIPDTIGNLKNLKELYLDNNYV